MRLKKDVTEKMMIVELHALRLVVILNKIKVVTECLGK